MRLNACGKAAALLLGACGAGAALAQTSVTIYGAIGTDVLSATNVSGGGSVVKVEDNAIVNSRIGFKGSEDLGGGLKAVFDLESSIAPDTGTSRGTQFWNRGAYVGLAGSFGSIKLGHQWNVSDDYMGNYFVFGYYSPFLMSGFGALSDYYDNAIKYNSPNIGGFEGGLYYTLGEQAGARSRGQKAQAAGMYAAGPFSIGATAFQEKASTAPLGTNTMYAVGASWDFKVVKARLGLATAKVEYALPFKARLLDVGADMPIGDRIALSLDYVKKDVRNSADDTDFARLRASYALSKRTSLNANLIRSRNKGNADFAFVTAAGGPGSSGAPGQSQTIVTAGITHSF
jgi:predicted porin